jgi:hypothetical protein
MRRLPLTLIPPLLACVGIRASADTPGETLAVVLEGLPPCGYGLGYEEPLRVELVRDEQVVATALHSGIDTGPDSLRVTLVAGGMSEDRYSIVVSNCGSLVDDARAAAACAEPDRDLTIDVRLTPNGIADPQIVRTQRIRARCLQPGDYAQTAR